MQKAVPVTPQDNLRASQTTPMTSELFLEEPHKSAQKDHPSPAEKVSSCRSQRTQIYTHLGEGRKSGPSRESKAKVLTDKEDKKGTSGEDYSDQYTGTEKNLMTHLPVRVCSEEELSNGQ